LQQPLGHDVESQVQTWVCELHSVPAPHATHLLPLVPQTLLLSLPHGTQVLPLQQPLGHDVESQTHDTPLHSVPVGQLTHAAPEVPHAVFASLVMHWLFEQQP
jgi:hypothetical protein